MLILAGSPPWSCKSSRYVDYAVSNTEFAELYLARYCAASGAKREDVLQWLPIQAGILLGAVPEKSNAALLQMMDGPMQDSR